MAIASCVVFTPRDLIRLRHSTERIQFSSPVRFLGGPGMLSRTSLASEDFLRMTSFSRKAVCMRRTLDWFLSEDRGRNGGRSGRIERGRGSDAARGGVC